ncbi:MAG: B12-binding domain-containing radical SAM protein [Candidatus Scalindua sp.]|jgi:anaerobic magnesium-protoporphyrin IX monomethyl ester cyclase|nr:B12-binding domain-containing radical SAM protein [Candidatus Scalindua sp.]
MNTDVLFIHPGNHKGNYQGLAREFTAIATPAWTLLLANYIRNKGYGTAIYDVNVDGWNENTVKEIVAQYNPDLVTIMVYGHNPSASTQTMSSAGKIAKDIKVYNKDIQILMGGIHPSALPVLTLKTESVDYVAQGEGAYTIEGLLRYLKGKGNINNVKGLWYKNSDSICFTTPAQVISDLDTELDGYAWDLLPDLNNYRAHNMHCFQNFEKSVKDDFSDVRTPYVAMNTSLGCPHSCHYCCINAIFEKPGIRYWSLEKVVSWIDTLVIKYGVRDIRFDDELFILSSQRVERFCELIKERGYDLNLWVYGRVDTIKESLIVKLKEAGINWICLGIESANEKVRSNVNKSIKKDIKDVVEKIQANDIYVLGNYMFGLPEDNLETMNETLDQAMELNCEFVNFYTVMAYPGSELYEWASKKDGYLPESWNGFAQLGYDTQPLPTKYLQATEVLRFRDEAFSKYYTNPDYMEMLERKFGNKVRVHMEKMLDINIKRRILGD